MAILNSVSIPTTGGALYQGTTLISGAASLDGLGTGTANKIDVATLASGRMETRKGLNEEGEVSLDGILTPQSAAAALLETAKQSQEGYNWEIRFGAARDEAGLSTGKGKKVQNGIAFTTIEADVNVSATAYKITLGNAKLVPAISDGDGITIDDGLDVHKVIRRGVEGGNGVVWVENATALTDADGGTIDLIRPGIVFQFIGTVDTYNRSAAVNDVLKFSLTIGSIPELVTTITRELS